VREAARGRLRAASDGNESLDETDTIGKFDLRKTALLAQAQDAFAAKVERSDKE